MATSSGYIAFEGNKRIAAGPLAQVALKAREAIEARAQTRILVFDQATSEQVDFDYRGTPEQMLQRLAPLSGIPSAHAEPPPANSTAPAGPGRPKLGVVAREVTLLPRHWEWLGGQPGGASVALRKLVEQAKRANQSTDAVRAAQEATYRFMSAMAGDLGGFEEAARALFAADRGRFDALIAPWPSDIRTHLQHLAGVALDANAIRENNHG